VPPPVGCNAKNPARFRSVVQGFFKETARASPATGREDSAGDGIVPKSCAQPIEVVPPPHPFVQDVDVVEGWCANPIRAVLLQAWQPRTTPGRNCCITRRIIYAEGVATKIACGVWPTRPWMEPPRDLLERTHYPKAFQLLASIWSAGPAPRLRKSLIKEYDTGLKKRVSCVRRAKKPHSVRNHTLPAGTVPWTAARATPPSSIVLMCLSSSPRPKAARKS
jgi:hypothetical protein